MWLNMEAGVDDCSRDKINFMNFCLEIFFPPPMELLAEQSGNHTWFTQNVITLVVSKLY